MTRLPGGRAGRSAGVPSGRSLHVEADLRLVVSAPDGRSAQVRVEDDHGTLRVVLARAADLRVVGASLPGGLSGVAGQAVRLVRRGQLPLPPWDQPVEVTVGSRVVLRRGRHGNRAGSPAARTAAVTGASLLALGAAVVLARRLLRR